MMPCMTISPACPIAGVFDRLDAALKFARADNQVRPTVISIDVDRFKQINRSAGLSAGDSILLTIARRLGRILRSQDTLSRISADQFAAIVISETETNQIIALADTIRRALATPVTFSESARSPSPRRLVWLCLIRNCIRAAKTC